MSRLTKEQEERLIQVQQQTLEYLRKRMIQDACFTMVRYKQETLPASTVKTITTIFQSRPKILSRVSENNLDILQQAAAMMFLWKTNSVMKTWLPENFETGIELKAEPAAQMILNYVSFQAAVRHYQSYETVMMVKIVSFVNDDLGCDFCKELSGKEFKLNELPELPHEKCTSAMGCRCGIRPVGDAGAARR